MYVPRTGSKISWQITSDHNLRAHPHVLRLVWTGLDIHQQWIVWQRDTLWDHRNIVVLRAHHDTSWLFGQWTHQCQIHAWVRCHHACRWHTVSTVCDSRQVGNPNIIGARTVILIPSFCLDNPPLKVYIVRSKAPHDNQSPTNLLSEIHLVWESWSVQPPITNLPGHVFLNRPSSSCNHCHDDLLIHICDQILELFHTIIVPNTLPVVSDIHPEA